jgi:hypothetical protein
MGEGVGRESWIGGGIRSHFRTGVYPGKGLEGVQGPVGGSNG